MALFLIPNLIDITYACFAFWIVFTSRLAGILVIRHPPLVCSRSIHYIHFLFFCLLVCTHERACYRLNLCLSYAIIQRPCIHSMQCVSERYQGPHPRLSNDLQRLNLQPSWRSLFDLLFFCLFGAATPHQSFIMLFECCHSSHEARARRSWYLAASSVALRKASSFATFLRHNLAFVS